MDACTALSPSSPKPLGPRLGNLGGLRPIALSLGPLSLPNVTGPTYIPRVRAGTLDKRKTILGDSLIPSIVLSARNAGESDCEIDFLPSTAAFRQERRALPQLGAIALFDPLRLVLAPVLSPESACRRLNQISGGYHRNPTYRETSLHLGI